MGTIFIPHSDYLAHSGTKGMRWGQRRYQNYDGSLTPEGRKRYGIGESRETKRAKKQAEKARAKTTKERAKANGQRKAEAQKAQEQKQKRMEYLRDHPSKLYKYRRELTQEDVDSIMEKVKFDESLKSIRKDQINKGMRKIDTIRQNTQTILNAYRTGKDVYNAVAEVNNAFIDMGINKNGKRMLKFGEKDNKALKELEALIRTPDGVEQVYNNRDKYSTDDLNKAFKRKQIENLLKSQVEANKKETIAKDNSQKKDTISDAVREAAYSNSPTKIMKAMSGANSAEKALLEKQLEEYESVVELMRKYR